MLPSVVIVKPIISRNIYLVILANITKNQICNIWALLAFWHGLGVKCQNYDHHWKLRRKFIINHVSRADVVHVLELVTFCDLRLTLTLTLTQVWEHHIPQFIYPTRNEMKEYGRAGTYDLVSTTSYSRTLLTWTWLWLVTLRFDRDLWDVRNNWGRKGVTTGCKRCNLLCCAQYLSKNAPESMQF